MDTVTCAECLRDIDFENWDYSEYNPEETFETVKCKHCTAINAVSYTYTVEFEADTANEKELETHYKENILDLDPDGFKEEVENKLATIRKKIEEVKTDLKKDYSWGLEYIEKIDKEFLERLQLLEETFISKLEEL